MLKVNQIENFLEFLRKKDVKISIAITGGGSPIVPILLDSGGMSSALHEIIVPYSPKSLSRFLGEAPEKACSAKTAKLMAQKLFEYSPAGPCICVALSASLAKREDEREGRVNEAFVCIATNDGIEENHIRFLMERDQCFEEKLTFPILPQTDSGQNRQFQETVCAIALLTLMAKKLGFEEK